MAILPMLYAVFALSMATGQSLLMDVFLVIEDVVKVNRLRMHEYKATFTFSHLADAFIQSDLQGIHIFYIYTDGTLHIRSNCSVSRSRTLRQGFELATKS